MPFGPFFGTPISDLPDYVIFQLIERRLFADLAAALNEELERRAIVRRKLRRAA